MSGLTTISGRSHTLTETDRHCNVLSTLSQEQPQTTVSFLDKIDPNTGVPGWVTVTSLSRWRQLLRRGHSPASPQSPPVLTVPNPPTNVGFHSANLDPASAGQQTLTPETGLIRQRQCFGRGPYYTPTTPNSVNSYIP